MAMKCDTECQKSLEKDEFKKSFKYYKRRQPPPSFKNVVDFTQSENDEVSTFDLAVTLTEVFAGLRPVSEWRAHQLKRYPGFVFIENPFTAEGQCYWTKRCLCDYPCKPSRCNLDAHVQLSENDNIFNMSARSLNGAGQEPSLLSRLRWVTMGYHHDWDTKRYTASNHTPLAADLSCLARYISSTIHWSAYQPQAAIINYYTVHSTLAGHTDHSELDHQAPLISVSFGAPAIFLLGGLTKQEQPMAMYLRSGDICIMSGPCRLAYHAVPRILPNPTPPGSLLNKLSPSAHQETETGNHRDCAELKSGFVGGLESVNRDIERCVKNTDFARYMEYLENCRINMNIRQVFQPGQRLPDMDDGS